MLSTHFGRKFQVKSQPASKQANKQTNTPHIFHYEYDPTTKAGANSPVVEVRMRARFL